VLFVTVACGACSGFHGIVSSGTTSKQISREPDCRLVGYGGMLLEALVAVIALSTVMMLAPADPTAQQAPDRIYANGLSHFVARFGIPRDLARSFALLAFATFIYDTLDVATRLGRYMLQELTGWQGRRGGILATRYRRHSCKGFCWTDLLDVGSPEGEGAAVEINDERVAVLKRA
jgi:carbon starvation protein